MRAILILFDSLSRHFLPPYGSEGIHAPSFAELGRRAVTFDNCHVGSMPCIPARRELHTGRYNFLHRSWGPLEPFDDSMPELLHKHGVHTHLSTDHYHYWEDGGATYHQRYSSYDLIRGQEGDKWKGEVSDPQPPEYRGFGMRQDWINRKYMQREEETSQHQTFEAGLEFIHTNHADDNWFLQIECFDPHPPFCAPERFLALYPEEYSGPHFDWPHYAPVSGDETPEMIAHMRRQYAALVSYCDYSLGRVMAAMEQYDMWDDTMLIVTTDHGFLLGEHGWWAFVRPPFYDEVARKPLLIHDPRSGHAGARNRQLVQMHDLPATLLDFFGAPLPADMQGVPLGATLADDSPVREAALFGVFGGHVNVTDGRHVYMHAPPDTNGPLYEYTLMPTHMKARFSVEECRSITLAPPFTFSKGVPVNRIEGKPFMVTPEAFGTLLYDLEADPKQEHPLQDADVKSRMQAHLVRLMRENDAPAEQYIRLGLTP